MPHLKVRYVNSEEFTNEFINAIRLNKTDNLAGRGVPHRCHRELDILLIDDIQFWRQQGADGRASIPFNVRYNSANKQIVLTSDLPPAQFQGLRGMRSRSLACSRRSAGPENRIAILHKQRTREGFGGDP